MKSRPRAAGLAAKWRSGCYAGRCFRRRSQVLLRGRKPKGMQKQEERPRVLPRYATAVGLGTQPAGWVGDRRRKGRSGPPRRSRGLLAILRPRPRGTAGRLNNAPRGVERSEGRGYCGGYLGLPSQSPSEGPTLHPAKVKGGVERGVPFTVFWLSIIFLTLESKFCHGHIICHTQRGP